MPRKKPFSVKQKKQQLQDKRRKKQDQGPQYGRSGLVDSDDDDKDSGPETTDIGHDKHVGKINQQPRNCPTGKYDPNRYRLHFFKESEEELAHRRKLARLPYLRLSEESLEVDIPVSGDEMLGIPIRPPWNYKLSKHQLEANEDKYFKGYINDIFDRHGVEELSYFEMNLETWRQLWRVIEISDIFLLITDVRHPNLHFSPGLYKYITEDLKKSVILVLNKVDLAPPPLVVAWQHYFKQTFPLVNIVCFTSFPKTKEELETLSGIVGKVVFKKRRRGTYRALGPRELYKTCVNLVQGQVDLSSWGSKIDSDQGITQDDDDEEEDGCHGNQGHTEIHEKPDCAYQEHEKYKDGVLTIGCVGYPNVGKSSILNGLMGKKVVSVSKTPGHTKHFQTIYLTPTVRLCDSPGLVFPSKVDRNLQLLGGMYPIAQVRQPYTPVGYIAQRLDVPSLLRIKPPDERSKAAEESDDASSFQWTPMNLCDAWAEKRGFITAKAARPDTYRAANNLLRLAVEGRLCLCLRPEGFTKSKDYWENHNDTKDFIELQNSYRQKLQASVDADSESAKSSSEDEEGGELSQNDDCEEGRQPESFTSTNPFDLLGEDD